MSSSHSEAPAGKAPTTARVSGLVSVIVPCLDSVEWLAQAIESALAQVYPLVEIIVADNGPGFVDQFQDASEPFFTRRPPKTSYTLM